MSLTFWSKHMNIMLKKKKVRMKITNIYLVFWVKINWNSFQNAQEDGNQSNLFAMSKLFVKSTIIICHFHLTTNTEAHFVRSKGNVNGSYMSCPLLRKLKEFSFNEEAMYIYCLLISPKDSINTFATCRKLLCRKSRAAVHFFIHCTTYIVCNTILLGKISIATKNLYW